MLRRYRMSMVVAAALAAMSAPAAYAAAGSDAQRQEQTAVVTAEHDTPRTRAEVVAETKAARAMGWSATFDEEHGRVDAAPQGVTGSLTREEVKAELAQAREEGLLDDSSSGPSPEVLARREAKNAEQYDQIVAANLQAEREQQATMETQQQVAAADTVEGMRYEEYLAAYATAAGDPYGSPLSSDQGSIAVQEPSPAGEPALSSTTQVEPEPLQQ